MSSPHPPDPSAPGTLPKLTFKEHLGIPHPIWEPFFDALESVPWPPDTLKNAVLEWTARVADSFEEPCEVFDAGTIVIVAGERGPRLAEAAARVTASLDRFLGDAGDGATPEDPHVIIEAPSHGEFLDMLDYWHSDNGDGDVRGDGAHCVGQAEYCHILMPQEPEESLEETLAHQLLHTYLRMYDAPAWLLQGLASEFMDAHFNVPFQGLDPQRTQEHLHYWNPTTIRSFWDGTAFESVEEGCDLAYELAHLITHKILWHHRPLIADFLSEARPEDAGDAASRSLFGAPIAALVTDFLGSGDWAPIPISSEPNPTSPEEDT